MSDQFAAGLTLLGLLPFVFGIGLFLIYLQVRKSKTNVFESLAALRAELRSMQTELREVQRAAQAFSVEDPEPFGGLVEQVIQDTSRFEAALGGLYRRYAALHTRANALARKAGFAWLRSVIEWYRLERETESLKADIVPGRETLAVVKEPADRLRRLGWEMASHSREILQTAQTAGEMFQELSREALIEDPELDSAWQDTREWEETLLAQVPVVYYQDDEQSVLARADKETTAHVYRVIKTARPAVQSLYERAQLWQSDYAKLASLMQEVHRGNKRTASLYTSLQKASLLPIEWEKTQAVMVRIGEQLDGVGAVIRKRSLEQLKVDLLALESLQAKISDVGKHVQWVSEQQGKLGTLISVIASQREEKWLERAMIMAEQAAQYDPDNFMGKVSVQSLGENLKHLATLWTQVLGTNPYQPIRESALPALTRNTEQAAALQESLRGQSELTRSRYEEILALEHELRDPLLRSRALLGQVTALIGSNPYLKRLVRSEPEGLSAQVETLLFELDQHGQGTVALKAKKITPALKKVEQAFVRWTDALAGEVSARKQELASKTEVLDSKMKLDEPAISDTIRLLRRVELDLSRDEIKPEEDILMAQIERLKGLNQAYQSCMINLQRLDDFAGTVLEMYTKAEKHRQSAVDRLARASEVAPETLKWPPSTEHLSNESMQMQELEQRWSSVQQEPLKAIQMAGKLSDLSERYQILDTQLSRLVDRAQQEQSRILEFEKRLDASKKMWQRQVTLNASNRMLQSGIQGLLDETNRDHEALKQRYERGLIQYQQALQGIRQICRRIDEASVPLDGQQDIDINGTVQRRM